MRMKPSELRITTTKAAMKVMDCMALPCISPSTGMSRVAASIPRTPSSSTSITRPTLSSVAPRRDAAGRSRHRDHSTMPSCSGGTTPAVMMRAR